MTGQRRALIKDPSIPKMPTDLVGKIYQDVVLADETAVDTAIHTWFRDDLGFEPCRDC